MKRVLAIFLFIFSLFSCDGFNYDGPKSKKEPLNIPDHIIDSGGFYISTRTFENEVAISWICKSKTPGLDFVLTYDTRYMVPNGAPSSIKNFYDDASSVGNIKSPYTLSGLYSGMIYYFTLEAFLDGETVTSSNFFEVKIP